MCDEPRPSFDPTCGRNSLGPLALLALVLCACPAQPEAPPSTHVAALLPAAPASDAGRPPTGSDETADESARNAAPSHRAEVSDGPPPAPPEPSATPPAGAEPDPTCAFVAREARKLHAGLPRQLDADTAITAVSARGCHLRLEYQLLTLGADEVTPRGILAMQARAAERLCSDPASRATLERGGTFTNVYLDRARAHAGEFTISAVDCVP